MQQELVKMSQCFTSPNSWGYHMISYFQQIWLFRWCHVMSKIPKSWDINPKPCETPCRWHPMIPASIRSSARCHCCAFSQQLMAALATNIAPAWNPKMAHKKGKLIFHTLSNLNFAGLHHQNRGIWFRGFTNYFSWDTWSTLKGNGIGDMIGWDDHWFIGWDMRIWKQRFVPNLWCVEDHTRDTMGDPFRYRSNKISIKIPAHPFIPMDILLLPWFIWMIFFATLLDISHSVNACYIVWPNTIPFFSAKPSRSIDHAVQLQIALPQIRQ